MHQIEKGQLKLKRNIKTEFYWEIIEGEENERNSPNSIIDYRTSGFSKCGFGGEVLVVGKVKDANKIVTLINTFCEMIIQGEKFALGLTHCIDSPDRKTLFKFNICEYETLNNGIKYQLIPLF